MFCQWHAVLAKKSVESVLRLGLFTLALLLVLTSTNWVHSQSLVTSIDGQTIALAQLPVQGQNMMRLIEAGGPFKYDKDGTVFGNRERILPGKSRGFYREYTVKTPGERTRGARRIVCGGFKPTAPEACYYTADHYASFRKITR